MISNKKPDKSDDKRLGVTSSDYESDYEALQVTTSDYI